MPRSHRRRKQRQRRPKSRFSINGVPVSQAAILARANVQAGSVDDNVRVCFLDDPEVGGRQLITGIGPDGVSTHEGVETEEPIPVVLLEPGSAVMLRRADGRLTEAQAEAAIVMGLQRWRGLGIFEVAKGWRVRRTDVGLELFDPTGQIFSRGSVTLPAQWVSAALSQRFVLVLYGVRVGVREPEDAGPYTAEQRWAELREAERAGIVAGGLVRFVNRKVTGRPVRVDRAQTPEAVVDQGQAGVRGEPPPFLDGVAALVRERRTRQTFGVATDASGRPLHAGELMSGSKAMVPDTSVGLRMDLEPRYLLAVSMREHVEGQVAAFMRSPDGPADVVLYLNNRPCERGEAACDKILPAILPRGSRLSVYVVAAGGTQVELRVYHGTGEWVTS